MRRPLTPGPRGEVLEATGAVLTSLPLSKVTMDDVARVAGLARGPGHWCRSR